MCTRMHIHWHVHVRKETLTFAKLAKRFAYAHQAISTCAYVGDIRNGRWNKK